VHKWNIANGQKHCFVFTKAIHRKMASQQKASQFDRIFQSAKSFVIFGGYGWEGELMF
jgi:hypothetical protein